MKKISFIFLILMSLLFTGCASKQIPAEITVLDEANEEITYKIHKTDDVEEVKEVFQMLCRVKPNSNCTGVSLHMSSALDGKVIVSTSETSTIDLGYTLEVKAQTNFKSYRMNGTIDVDGHTNTESPSLSFKTINHFSLEINNDEEFAYLKGDIQTGDNRVAVKNKINIEEFSKRYKSTIQASIELLKYYNPVNMIPDLENWIEAYQISIVNTTRNTFTLQLHIPSSDLFEDLSVDAVLDIDVEINCETLFPVQIEMTADEVISKLLKDQYIESYLTDNVQIQNPKFSISIQLEYGNYTIKELTKSEKETYKEYIE